MESSLLKVLLAVALFSSVHGGLCGNRKLHGDLSRAAVRASDWLNDQMDESGTFKMGHVTAHAFHSLRLVGHDVNSKFGAEYLGKELSIQGLESITGGRLALYILGVLSLCKCMDPRYFNQQNLVDALQTKLSKYPTAGFDDPYQYSLAVIALCSAGAKFSSRHVVKLMDAVPPLESNATGCSVDALSMGIVAMSCIYRKRKDMPKLKLAIKVAVKHLTRIQRKNRGQFGNEISTSGAVTALLAARVKGKLWNCASTLKYLLSMQNGDGSFGGVYDTIQILPALIGALPYDVADLPCPKASIKRKEITVCVKLDFDQTIVDKTAPPPEYFTVLNGTNAHDLLKLARKQHPCYDFTVENFSFGHMITSICGVSQDPKRKWYWMIYIAPEKPAPYGIDQLKPIDGSCVIFKFMKLREK